MHSARPNTSTRPAASGNNAEHHERRGSCGLARPDALGRPPLSSWTRCRGLFRVRQLLAGLRRVFCHRPHISAVAPRRAARRDPLWRDTGLRPGPLGRLLIARAVRKKVLIQKPFGDLDYVLALDDATRLGALRFRPVATDVDGPFLAATGGKLPPLMRLKRLAARCRRDRP